MNSHGIFYDKSLLPLAAVLMLILTGNCTSTKALNGDQQLIQVNLMKHDPYCGGAFPTEKQIDGRLTYLADQTLYLKRGNINSDKLPIIAKVMTDSLGTFQIQLNTGIYCLIFPEKQLPFQEFLQTVSEESRYLKAGKESCFAQWWKTPEVVFEVSDTTRQVQSILKRSCYTGFNPCMIYSGPLRR